MEKQTELTDSWSVVSDEKNIAKTYAILSLISAVSLAVIFYASYSVI